MGVVHNIAYFYWFERARHALMAEIMPYAESQALGIATPVVENHCEYTGFAHFDETLTVITRHRVLDHPEVRLTFQHEIVRGGKRTPVATGHSVIALMNWNDQTLAREWPQDTWNRYQTLR